MATYFDTGVLVLMAIMLVTLSITTFVQTKGDGKDPQTYFAWLYLILALMLVAVKIFGSS